MRELCIGVTLCGAWGMGVMAARRRMHHEIDMDLCGRAEGNPWAFRPWQF